MLRILLPFMLGIRVSLDHSPGEGVTAMLLWSGLLLMAPGALAYGKVYNYRTRWVHGIIVVIAMLVLGMACGSYGLRPHTRQLVDRLQDADLMIVRTQGSLKFKPGAALVFAEVEGRMLGDRLLPCEGRIRIRVRGDSLAFLTPGQRYLMPARCDSLSTRSEPGGFDYSRWLRRQGVVGLGYLDSKQLFLLSPSSSYNLRAWGHRQQQRISAAILEMLPDSGLAGLASAMLVGELSGLDEEVSEAFRRSGVVHILSVSGLHTGTVYAGITGLMALLTLRRRRKAWMEFLPLSLVFLFALMTGLAPAVSRATLMITLHTLSRMVSRRTEGLNILAGSAFLMLMIVPAWLFNLGFWLSFLAVAGIMLLYAPSMAVFGLSYGRWRKALGGLAMVSLVAQLATAPLCLYSFHAFPAYFLPANLLAVPLSTVAIYTGMVALPLHMAGLPDGLAVRAFGLLLQWMRDLSTWFADLPCAYIEYIPFSTHSLVMSYVGVALLAMAPLLQDRLQTLRFLVLVMIIWAAAGLVQKSLALQRKETWLLSGPRPVLAELNGREARVWGLGAQADSSMQGRIRAWALQRGTPAGTFGYHILQSTGKSPPDTTLGRAFAWHPSRRGLVVWCDDPVRLQIMDGEETGIILVTGLRGLRSLKRWPEELRPQVLVLDASVRYLKDGQREALEERSGKVWIMAKMGSLQLE